MKKCKFCGFTSDCEGDVEYYEEYKGYVCCTCFYKKRQAEKEQTKLPLEGD